MRRTDDRQKVDLGVIKLTKADPNGTETEKLLFMDPVHLTDGIELSDDPLMASYHAAALAPLSTHDQQRLLLASGPTERWKLLDEMLDEQFDILRFHIGGGAI